MTGSSGTPAGQTSSPRSSGNANPVAGPFFNLSTPEPTGVVAVLAPSGVQSAGAGQCGRTRRHQRQHGRRGHLPADRPLPAVTFAEVLATSDVPAGVVNILTGSLERTAPTLASHMDVNAIDLTGLAGEVEQATALEVEAVRENLKRVRRAPAAEPDWTLDPGLDRMTGFLETKTIWRQSGVSRWFRDGRGPDLLDQQSVSGRRARACRSPPASDRGFTDDVAPSTPCLWWTPLCSLTLAPWNGFQ